MKTKHKISAYPSGFELKASRPPGCNGGVNNKNNNNDNSNCKLIRIILMAGWITTKPQQLFNQTQNQPLSKKKDLCQMLLKISLKHFFKFQVCYCNHYNYCNDRHNVTIGKSNTKNISILTKCICINKLYCQRIMREWFDRAKCFPSCSCVALHKSEIQIQIDITQEVIYYIIGNYISGI